MLRLKDLQEIVLPAEQLDHYEVRFMQLGYVNEHKPKTESEDINPSDSVKRTDRHMQEAKRDKTCEYRVIEDLLNQLTRNNATMNRGVR